MAAIYAPVVASTVVSFEMEPPDGREMAARVARTVPDHPWLVMDVEPGVVGYAYAHRFQGRAAYDWAVETSIYVGEGWRGKGIGRRLYRALLAVLRAQGYCRAVAGVTLPNAVSVALHESVGFRAVGVYHRVGWKFGAWHDVGMWELDLAPGDGPPPQLTPFRSLTVDALLAAP